MNICLYGASSNEINPSYIRQTELLGKQLARRGHSLIFGGGGEGLMGAAARGVFSAGGKITGVAPSFFNVDGRLYKNCTELIYTETMRERKEIMETKADGFIVTPGGPGTFDEFFEILTLRQLGRHTKPIAVFNICGYYDSLAALLKNAAEQKFMTDKALSLCFFSSDCGKLIDYIEEYKSDPSDIGSFKYIK